MDSIICISADPITLTVADMALHCTCTVLTDITAEIKPTELKKTRPDRCAQNGLHVCFCLQMSTVKFESEVQCVKAEVVARGKV